MPFSAFPTLICSLALYLLLVLANGEKLGYLFPGCLSAALPKCSTILHYQRLDEFLKCPSSYQAVLSTLCSPTHSYSGRLLFFILWFVNNILLFLTTGFSASLYFPTPCPHLWKLSSHYPVCKCHLSSPDTLTQGVFKQCLRAGTAKMVRGKTNRQTNRLFIVEPGTWW